MSGTRIELHARQSSDLSTLTALRRALEQLGEEAALTAAAGVVSDRIPGFAEGPVDCHLRVMIAGPLSLGDQSAQRCAVIVDEIDPPWRLVPPELRSAELVFVPGPWQQNELRSRASGELVAAGLSRLDELVCDPAGARARARTELSVPQEADVVLYAPSGDPRASGKNWLCDEIVRLPATGPLVLVQPSEGEKGLEWCRALASSVPGLALPDGVEPARVLAACDVVVSDRASLLYEAAALGRGGVLIEPGGGPQAAGGGILDPCLEVGPRVRRPDELATAVRSAQPGSSWSRQYAEARARCRTELLLVEGSAAERIAHKLCEYMATLLSAELEAESAHRSQAAEPRAASRPREEPGPSALVPRPSPLAAIEARVAFGEVESASEELAVHLESEPSPAGYRLLASLHRKLDDTSGALEAAERAEQLARRETAEALCERGRALVDADRVEAAHQAFEQARELAPDLVDAQVGLGSIALHAGDAGAAEQYFERALAREKSARTHTGAGLARLGLGRPREALHSFEQALDIQADYISAVYGIVQAAFRTGEVALAERRVRAFVELHSANLDLVFTLAGLRCELGDRAGALEMLERIELFDPAYPGLVDLRQKLA